VRVPASGRTVALIGLAAAALLCSCSASRVGWGKGRFAVVRESPTLQVRRGPIRAEGDDVVLKWIGARTPPGQPLLAELTVTVFDDRDGDSRVGPGEMRIHRTLREPTTKILFSDLRLPRGASDPTVLVVARTAVSGPYTESFALRPE